jgi:hypothetical protein
LKICVNESDERAEGARPTEFVSNGQADSPNDLLMIFEREPVSKESNPKKDKE